MYRHYMKSYQSLAVYIIVNGVFDRKLRLVELLNVPISYALF
jgi:hypothetical protein